MTISEVPLHLLDLNLLRIFEVLLEEGNVTRTALRLHLTPSAVSHALGRLRGVLNDDLFIRAPNGMQPTPFSLDIGPRVQHALRQLERAVLPSKFEPAASTREFVLTMSHYLCWALLPRIMRQFRIEAPGATIHIRPRVSTLIADFELGKVDIALGQFGTLPDRFVVEPIIHDQWVWVFRPRKEEESEPLTLQRLSTFSHVMIKPGVGARSASDLAELPLEAELSAADKSGQDLEHALAENGLPHFVSLHVPDTISALAVAGQTDLAALVPGRLARCAASQYGLVCHEPPYSTTPIEYQMAWHKSHGEEPGTRWLRSLIRNVAQAMRDDEACDSSV